MRLVQTILLLRLKQGLRLLKELETGRLIFLLLVVILSVYGPVTLSMDPALQPLVAAGWLMLLGIVQRRRSDGRWLQAATEKRWHVQTVEYATLSIPIVVLFAVYGGWLSIGIVLSLLPLVALIPQASKHQKQRKSLPLPVALHDVEWRWGIRMQWLALLAVEIAGVAIPLNGIPALVAMLVLSATAAGFYQQCESASMLTATNKSAKAFLHWKLKRGLGWLAILQLPQVIAFLVQAPQLWYLLVYVLLLSFAVLGFAILLKYSSFAAGQKLGANSVTVAIFAGFGLMPILCPIPALMFWRQYPEAIKTLSFHLHAGE